MNNCGTDREHGTIEKIVDELDEFKGEPSFKRLFWELLSYDRARDLLPLSFLPQSSCDFVTNLEVFASSDAATIVLASVRFVPDSGRLEQITWALKRHIPNCVVLLQNGSNWSLIFPDEVYKPRVRFLPLPGPANRRLETAQAIASLNAADDDTGEELSALEMAQSLDESFPGATPNIADVLTDFERIAEHPEPEMRELRPLIRQAGQYPLLTPAQERGDDIRGDEQAPDGTGLTYHQWRLIVHNLRLVVWIARQWRGRGLELPDLVQEGTIGLMTAARRYDPTRGNRFTTFAYWWVLQGVTRALFNNCNLIRWPVYTAPELMKAAREGEEAGLTAGQKPPLRVRWRLDKVAFYETDPIESTIKHQMKDAVDSVLEQLTVGQRFVLERRFGISCDHEHTLEEIGQQMGLTRERIRQIEAKALTRLRGPKGVGLKPHYDCSEWRVASAYDEGSNGRNRSPLWAFDRRQWAEKQADFEYDQRCSPFLSATVYASESPCGESVIVEGPPAQQDLRVEQPWLFDSEECTREEMDVIRQLFG